MKLTREVSRPLRRQHRQQFVEHHRPESSPVTRRCHQPLPPSTADHRERRIAGLANWARPASTPMPMTPTRSCRDRAARSPGATAARTARAAWRSPTPFRPTAGRRDERAGEVRRRCLRRRRRRLVGRRRTRRGRKPQLPHRVERARSGESGAQPQDRAARQLVPSARQLKASQLGSARSRESQSTCWVSQLPLGDPAPLHMPPVSRRSTIADEPPPSSSTALSAPSPRNRSWIWSGV